jgi:2-(1,2-epoxy-1,2-dihydrophenyl)acetyl-CoA isomerase
MRDSDHPSSFILHPSSDGSAVLTLNRLGLPPDGGNSAFLVRTVGAARAMELLLTNRSLSADEALAWGLVNEVVPPERLLEHAREVAASFVAVPAETLLATRGLLDGATCRPLAAQLDDEEAAMCAAARRDDFRAAVRAFIQRRSTSSRGQALRSGS